MNRNLKAEIIRRFGNQANFSHALREHTTVISAVLHGKMTLDAKRREAWTQLLGEEAMETLEGNSNE
jgi:hypothetical protein